MLSHPACMYNHAIVPALRTSYQGRYDLVGVVRALAEPHAQPHFIRHYNYHNYHCYCHCCYLPRPRLLPR